MIDEIVLIKRFRRDLFEETQEFLNINYAKNKPLN
jgi:hypothetical protein